MALIKKSTSSSTTNNNLDARVVGGDSSVNQSLHLGVSGRQNTVHMSTTDHGAVAGSLALALRGVEGAQQLAREATAAQGGLFDGALKMAGEQQQQTLDVIEKIKTSDVRTLVITGLAVVGLAAAMYFRKG